MRRIVFLVSLFLTGLAGCGGGGGTGTTQTKTTATPAFSPASGTYTATQSVTITDATSGASIYYTTDGSTPTASSTPYSAPISVSATTTIKAIAAASGYTNSSVATATYTITQPSAATPTFTPAPGTYTAAQSVTIADSTAGASVYYTVDGTTPTTSSTLYTQPIAIAATTTIKAIAAASGFANSSAASGTYTIALPAADAPVLSPAPGTYTSAQSVTLTDDMPGATIYYTTDGSTPTVQSQAYNGAIDVAADTSIAAIAIAPGYAQSSAVSGTYLIAGPTVSSVLSTMDQTSLMTAQPDITFTTTTAGSNKIVVDEAQQYQTMDGFGAAFTDSAAYLLEKVAPSATLTSTLNDLFTRDGNGIGLSFMRNPMGASDIARSVYSFDDLTGTQTDPTLANFSVSHDESYIIPLVQQAKTLNPQMKIMANPWSPPGWMKTTNSMIGGTLLPTMYTPFAQYFVKYIQAYAAAGIPIDYISLQNEPLYQPSNYPGMGMDAATQLAVLRDYVLPALQTANLSTQVLVYDHNWDTVSYPETVLNDPTILASSQVAGTAWHGYGGTPGGQQTVANLYPTKGAWQTEHSGGTWITNQFTNDFLEITQVLRNAGKAYVKWSLALDQNLGPNLSQISGYGGCSTCTPIVTVNNQTGAVTKDIEYYTLGHYSKYVLPGATRIYSSNANGIVSVAFTNPDDSKALIAYNNTGAVVTFQVQWGAQSFTYTLPRYAAATFTWSGTQSGAETIAATSQIQASSYTSQNGLATENTSDTTAGYDLGYLTPGSYALYKNVDFGTSVSKVSMREASAGNGGTAEFHLDSPSGTLVATATLSVTGGWQTWTTVTATASGASGVHDLYVVFKGGGSSGSIANVNWFQFQ
jgi:glucosylceramidase